MRMTHLLWLMGLSALAADGRGGGGGMGASEDPSLLAGTWVLEAVAVGGDLLPADPQVRTELTFADGRALGSGGVNRFTGPFEATASGTLAVGPVAATRMAGPPHAMEQEDRFFAALGAVARFVVEETGLSLLDDGGQPLLVLHLAQR